METLKKARLTETVVEIALKMAEKMTMSVTMRAGDNSSDFKRNASYIANDSGDGGKRMTETWVALVTWPIVAEMAEAGAFAVAVIWPVAKKWPKQWQWQ